MCQNFSKLLRTEVTKFESFFFQIIFQKTYSKDLLALMASLHLPNRSVACKVTTWNLENNSAHRCDLVESGKESLVSATTGGFGAASEQLFVYVKIFSPFFLVCFFTFNHSCHSCVFFHNFLHVYSTPKTPIVMASHHDIILHSRYYIPCLAKRRDSNPAWTGQNKDHPEDPLDHSMNHLKLPPHFLSWGRGSAIWPSNLIELPFL